MYSARLALVIVVATLGSGCDDRRPPAAPSPAAGPTVVDLRISGANTALTGVSSGYTATATLSDGTMRAVTATWSTSDPEIASVDSAGRFEGRAHGSTTLTASYEGRSASTTVQVVNNYGGTWIGRYVTKKCDDSGDFEDGIAGGNFVDVPWCQLPFHHVGTEHPIELTLSQTGSNYTEVTATVYGARIAGVVTPDGRLSLGGSITLSDFEGLSVWGTMEISEWDSILSGAGVLTGRWSENLTLAGGVGNAYTQHELVAMTRAAPSAAPRPVSR